MKKILHFFIFCGLLNVVCAQTNEFTNLRVNKSIELSNPNCVFLDKSKVFYLPADGAFLYSSHEGEMGVMSSGYNNNEDFILTIKNQYNRKIYLKSHYFFTEANNDILEIYDGQDTAANLIKSVSGIPDKNFLIVSSGEFLTLRFKTNNSGTFKGFRFRIDNGFPILNRSGSPLPTPMSCASTPAADECVNAPLICDLNGYCGNTSGSYTPGNTSALGSFCGSIENNSWLSFVASSTSASLGFNSSGCQSSGSGIQAVIYASSNCTSFTEVSNCVSQGSGSGTFTISTNVNLVPGQTYYVMIDGFAGNICNYTVTAQAGIALGQQMTGPSQLCPGYNGVLGASSTASSYTWTSSPPGVYPNTQTISITPTVTTTYTLTLGASPCSPAGTTVVKTVTVTNTLNPANITAPNPICMGSNITLSSLTNGGTYAWTGPNGFTGNTQNPTVNNWSSANNGAYSLVITYGAGCATSPASVNLSGTPTPTINISAAPSLTVCNGQSVVLTGTGGTGVNGYTWNWNVLQASVSTELCTVIPGIPAVVVGGFTVTPAVPGSTNCVNNPLPIPGISTSANATVTPNQNTQVCTSSQNAAGCAGQSCVNIVVLPAAASLTISPSVTICPAQSATLTVSGGSNYTWTPAANLSSTSSGTTVATPATTTIYTVSAPGCGGTATATTQVTINSSPPSIGTVDGLTAVCANQTGVTYSVANVASANYTWTVPSGATITSTPTNSNAITVNFGTTAGSVTAIAATACGSATSIVSVNITSAGNLTVTPSMTVCPSSTITLSAIGGSTYTWSPSATLNSANGSTVSATPATTTTYSVNSISCGVPVTATVEININGAAPTIGLIDGQFVICNSAKTGLTYSVTNAPGATYSWTVPSGATITSSPLNSNSITVNYGASSGSIIVTATTACGSATSIATMTLIPSPTITATANSTICTGGSATLNANGGASYTWSPGGSNGTSLAVTPTTTTTYTLTGDNGIGCTNTSTVEVAVVTSPTLVISPDFTVCPSTAHTFSASGATNYTWTPNIFLNTNTSGTVVSTPTITTTYTVVGSTIASCMDTKTVSITVSNTVVVSASATSPTICPLGNTALTASGAAGYTWTPGITLNSTTGSTVTATPSSSQTYTVLGATGTCTNSAQVVVTVTTTPVITVANSPTICSGGSAALNASGANSYTWSPATNLTATVGANVTANPNLTTVYTVSATTTLGCHNFTTVTVGVIPTPTLVLSANPSSICAGKSSTLSVFGANTFVWSPAASLNTTTGSAVTASPILTTTYIVLGTNSIGTTSCTSSNSIVVIVNPNTIVTTSLNDTICLNSSKVITASGGDTYNWNPTTGLTSPTSSITIAQPITTTIYTVTASNGGLCPGTHTVQIFVRPLPTLNAGRDTSINIDETYVLHGTGSVPVGFLSPDGVPLICHYCPIVEVHPLETTCYTLEAEDRFGCINYDDVCITITKNWDVFIPNAFTPNGDIDNEYFMPKGFGLAQINMSIFDRWGVEIFKENDTKLGWDGTYKGVTCQQGVYIYQIETTSLGGVKYKKTGHVNVLSKVK